MNVGPCTSVESSSWSRAKTSAADATAASSVVSGLIASMSDSGGLPDAAASALMSPGPSPERASLENIAAGRIPRAAAGTKRGTTQIVASSTSAAGGSSGGGIGAAGTAGGVGGKCARSASATACATLAAMFALDARIRSSNACSCACTSTSGVAGTMGRGGGTGCPAKTWTRLRRSALPVRAMRMARGSVPKVAMVRLVTSATLSMGRVSSKELSMSKTSDAGALTTPPRWLKAWTSSSVNLVWGSVCCRIPNARSPKGTRAPPPGLVKSASMLARLPNLIRGDAAGSDDTSRKSAATSRSVSDPSCSSTVTCRTVPSAGATAACGTTQGTGAPRYELSNSFSSISVGCPSMTT